MKKDPLYNLDTIVGELAAALVSSYMKDYFLKGFCFAALPPLTFKIKRTLEEELHGSYRKNVSWKRTAIRMQTAVDKVLEFLAIDPETIDRVRPKTKESLMKILKKHFPHHGSHGFVFAAFFLLFLPWTTAAAPKPVVLLPESQLWLQGDSTLHHYASTAAQVNVTATFDPDSQEVASLSLSVPVKSLQSGKKALDKNLQEALKAGEYPDIRFELKDYEATRTTAQGKNRDTITAQGLLFIAGVEKPVTLEARGEPDSRGLAFSGETEILMTDFGVKPPKMMLGALKVDNRVVVHYHLILGQK